MPDEKPRLPAGAAAKQGLGFENSPIGIDATGDYFEVAGITTSGFEVNRGVLGKRVPG